MIKEEIKELLVEEGEYDPMDVETMSDYSLFDSILSCNGIVGFTDDIIAWYKSCFEESTFDNLDEL